MTTPTDDQSDAYKEALEYYTMYIIENAEIYLVKEPSEKQMAAILNQIIQSHEEDDFDLDVILEQHARNCFKPLYFKEPDIREEVARIMSAFLAIDDPNFDEILLNDEDPPLHIRQLLKKPSFERLAEVVKALQEDNPNWSHYDLDDDRLLARHLVLVLGNNFPDLIKQNSHTRIIFGNLSQDSANSKPPPLTKAKTTEKKKSYTAFLVIALVLLCFGILSQFCLSSKSSKTQEDETARPQMKSEVTDTPKQNETAKVSPSTTTLENLILPITLVSIAEFSLLDKTGLQTTIPSGSLITVDSRSVSGTLSMRINGEPFVGNESRLAGKAKVKEN